VAGLKVDTGDSPLITCENAVDGELNGRMFKHRRNR
jgi:hypothetical protein